MTLCLSSFEVAHGASHPEIASGSLLNAHHLARTSRRLLVVYLADVQQEQQQHSFVKSVFNAMVI